MSTGLPHISVCICTYRRQTLLKRLLEDLARQDTGGRFTHSIVVVDNDHLRSAEAVVAAFASHSSMSVTYCVEPRQNIALARNKAAEKADGEFVACIDDDQFPIQRWLLTLFEACQKYDVDGVLGPVKPHYEEGTPPWVIKARFYERATYPTGLVLDWRKGRTANVLLRRRVFSGEARPFRAEFRSGEDQDFFQRMIEKGHRFIWCNEAVAYEFVPPMRWKRSFMLRRALLRGAMEPLTAGFGARDIARSIAAVTFYSVTLPFALVLGQHRFMKLLVKLFDHLGKLFACVGLNPIKEPYVTH